MCFFLAEGNGVAAEKRECCGEADRFEFAVDGFGIECAGLFTEQAEDDRAICAVTCAGEGERAIEIGEDFDGGVEEIALVERQEEGARRAHGPHGMRAGRPDTDLVEIEQGGFHDWL